MNRFGANERHAPEDKQSPNLLTQAYLHYWDKGRRVPADLAARLLEEGYDVEALASPISLMLWQCSAAS